MSYHRVIGRPTLKFCALLLVVPALAACGGGREENAGFTATAPRAPLPALATRPAAPGEIVVRGEASPETKGPFAFDGRYLVRFEQYAPEDAGLDFTAQTPFSAALAPRRDDPRGAIELVEDAARRGRRTITVHGRYFVSVSFGDFPYVVRFTPRR